MFPQGAGSGVGPIKVTLNRREVSSLQALSISLASRQPHSLFRIKSKNAAKALKILSKVLRDGDLTCASYPLCLEKQQKTDISQ